MIRAKGCIRDDHELLDRKFGAVVQSAGLHFGAGATPREATAMYEAVKNVPFRDQGQTSSCTGHGLTRAANACLAVRGVQVPYGSPLAAYTGGRMLGRSPARERLTDDGAMPRSVMQYAAEFGIPAETEWPLVTAELNQDLPPDIMQRGSAWKLKEQIAITTKGAQRVADARSVLAANHPLIVAADVDEAFESAVGSDIIQAPDPSKVLGGHMICVLAYRTNASGRTEFLIGNSWSGWGFGQSFAWASESWLTALSDLYAFTLTHGPVSK